MSKIISLFILTFLIFINYANAEDKIMFIDLDFIYKNSVAGKKINDQLRNRAKNLNNEINKFNENINKEKENLVNQKNVLSENEYREKIIALEKKIKEINSNIANKNNNLSILTNKAKAEFSVQLKDILQQYAEQNSIIMIINKNNILIGKNNLDASNDVLALFDKNIKSIKIQ